MYACDVPRPWDGPVMDGQWTWVTWQSSRSSLDIVVMVLEHHWISRSSHLYSICVWLWRGGKTKKPLTTASDIISAKIMGKIARKYDVDIVWSFGHTMYDEAVVYEYDIRFEKSLKSVLTAHSLFNIPLYMPVTAYLSGQLSVVLCFTRKSLIHQMVDFPSGWFEITNVIESLEFDTGSICFCLEYILTTPFSTLHHIESFVLALKVLINVTVDYCSFSFDPETFVEIPWMWSRRVCQNESGFSWIDCMFFFRK